MVDLSNKKRFDLDERTQKFAMDVRVLLKRLMKTMSNIEDSKQLIRSSGSVAANYIEACEALSRKDFIYRIKICRKEVKESILFLHLLDFNNNSSHEEEKEYLIREGTELMKIFGSIITKANR